MKGDKRDRGKDEGGLIIRVKEIRGHCGLRA